MKCIKWGHEIEKQYNFLIEKDLFSQKWQCTDNIDIYNIENNLKNKYNKVNKSQLLLNSYYFLNNKNIIDITKSKKQPSNNFNLQL